MPTVSVIIPTYNRSLLLKEAIQSVLDQTYSDYEIIVVDDGSTDNTPQLVKELRRYNNKVKYIYQENKGRSAARNLGLRIARGEYIAFLDSDDIFMPEKLRIQVSLMEKNKDFGMVFSAVLRTDRYGHVFEYDELISKKMSGWIYPELLFIKNNIITVPGVMLRAQILNEVGGFNEKMHICEDLDLWRRIAMRYRILQIKQSLALVRHYGYDSTVLEQKVAARAFYYEKAIIDDPSLEKTIQTTLFSEMYSHYGIEALNNGRLRFGIYLLMKSAQTNFFQFIRSCVIYSIGLIRSGIAFWLLRFLSPAKYRLVKNFYKRLTNQ